jgi:two-component system, NtrC family, sensor kinase
MQSYSLRFKMTVLVVGLTVGSSLAASAVHGWLAFRELKEDVRSRATAIASDIAFGITTPQELANRQLLAAEVRNILAARPTLKWLDVYAQEPGGFHPIASSREGSSPDAHPLVVQALAENRTVTAGGRAGAQEVWVAAAPIHLEGQTVGAVSLAISLEGANRLALNLGEQLLLVLVVTSATMIAGLALFSEQHITRPIAGLLRTMSAVEGGDLSATPAAGRQDELGRLAQGLTAMLARIRESHAENTRLVAQINRFNQDLQQRVAEATQELERRNDALGRATELLFDLQRELGRSKRLATMGHMTATIAHEIGSPLNSVAVHLQLLGRSPGLTDQDRQRLATIDGQIQRLVRTVQERLVATQGLTRRTEPTDLNALVQGMTDLMAPVLAGKGITCRFTPNDGLPKLQIDGPEIQQVVLNLLTNAVDAMPGGGSLAVEITRTADAAVLRVADSGPGIPAEIRPRIFEPFFTTKAQGKGTGLGLAICRQIVEAHGGSVGIADTPGGGATLEIRLPLPSPEPAR